ncbi:DUF72 domain-containing protein [Mucilaginibacter sp. HD30]
MEWHIGCSGFHYKHWKERFYPEGLPQKKWFEYYCQHFKTLELNVTFYRFPRLSFLQNWHSNSPDDFRFAVKAPRAITHYRKFINTVDFISSFYDTINNGLQEKLGPVLFQLPPNFQFDEEKLDRVINSLDPSFNNVFEPRHVSWWNEKVYNSLAQKNITFCGMSYPGLPDEVIQNASSTYYRFHGVPQLYSSPYSEESLKKVINAIHKPTREGWFYFNNDVNAVAPRNAEEMMVLLPQ